MSEVEAVHHQVEAGARRRWPWWARSLLVAAAAVSLLLLVLAAVQLLDRSDFSTVTLAGPVQRIDVQVARGSIELVPGTSEDVVMQRTSRWRFRRPTVEAFVDGGTARVRAICPRAVLVVGTCSVTHRIEVPPGVRVDVRTDEGEVTVRGLDGWIRIVTTNGRVTGSELLAPQLLVDTSGGAVELVFSEEPSYVEVVSGGGDVELVLPGGPYEAFVEAGDGAVRITAAVEELAERLVYVATRGGDVALLAP